MSKTFLLRSKPSTSNAYATILVELTLNVSEVLAGCLIDSTMLKLQHPRPYTGWIRRFRPCPIPNQLGYNQCYVHGMWLVESRHWTQILRKATVCIRTVCKLYRKMTKNHMYGQSSGGTCQNDDSSKDNFR